MAYFMLRYSQVAGDDRALEAAAHWGALAERNLDDAEAFVAASNVFPDHRFPLSPSLYFGEAGVWCAGALVHDANGDAVEVRRAVGRFSAIADACPDDALDATWGAASLLLGTAALVEELGEPHATQLIPVGERLAGRLESAAVEREQQDADSVGWLGAAHGWCGIAHALLRWCQATSADPSPALLRLLDWLGDVRLPSGLWPRREDSTDVWPGWCHGSAGWVQLWTLAWEVLRDDHLLELAEQAARHAVAAGEVGGGGLCCGQAGEAYAALALHRSTGDENWLAHAHRLAADAGRTPPGEWFPEHSLWRGDVGVALLALELAEPLRAAMPLYRALA